MFKGFTAAGYRIGTHDREAGVFLSVENQDLPEVVSLAKKLYDIGMSLYATPDTAEAIRALGIDAMQVSGMADKAATFSLLESGQISYIVYTGALFDRTLGRLHRAPPQGALARHRVSDFS